MSSNLKVNTILPSTGTTVAVSGIVSATSSVSIGSSCTATTFYGSTLAATGAITASGTIETTGSELKITGTEPRLTFTDTDNNPDFQIWANAQRLSIYDSTNSATRIRIDSSGNIGMNTTTASDSTGNCRAYTFTRTDVNGQVRLILKNQATGFGNGAGYHQGIDGANVFIENRTNGGYLDLTTNNSGSIETRVRIDSSGRVSVGRNLANYVASDMSSAANDFIITTGAGSNGGMSIVNSGADIGNIFFAHGSSENSIGRIAYNHNGDDFTFTAGGNTRGRIYNDAGVTGIENHRFMPFLIGYDIQSTSNIVMAKGFGGMSRLAMNADGDKAYMSYVTHWRHRQYSLVRFWYGASGNTSGATFDWDFTVWSATNNEGYSVGSNHSFTVTSGTMSNGKMYGYNIVSSWPSHHNNEFVQFQIEFDELQEGTSLQLAGLELVEYTTP